MRILALAAFLAVGCGPAAAIIEDQADPNDDGTDTNDPGDTGDPGDPGDTGDPGNEPDLSAWSGTRNYSFPDIFGQACEDSVEEDGVNVTDDIDYNGAREVCPDCDEIFAVDVTPATLCEEQTGGQGIPVATEIMRGLQFSTDRGVIVYRIEYSDWEGWTASELATGTLTGTELDYSYEGNVYGAEFTATGVVDF